MKVKPNGKNITLGCYIESLPETIPVTLTLACGSEVKGLCYRDALFFEMIPIETKEGIKFVYSDKISVIHIWDGKKDA